MLVQCAKRFWYLTFCVFMWCLWDLCIFNLCFVDWCSIFNLQWWFV